MRLPKPYRRTVLSTPEEVAGRLAEAQRPFAEAAEHLHPALPDDGVTLDGFTVAQVRNAYAVYHSLQPTASAPGGDGDAWRDISTAPKDGRTVCLAELQSDGRWTYWSDYWRAYAPGYGEGFSAPRSPSHWAPPPPATPSEGG